jgi:hypothetical protein
MKSITGFLVGAVVIAIIGAGFISAGRFERNMADAQEYASTERYDEARARLDAADAYLPYGRWIPRVGAAAENDVRARRAALEYWQRNYAAVLPRDADPVGGVEASNLELQTIVANAAYRAGQASATDRQSTLQAFDEAIGGFQTVLKNDTWSEDAAFNYEYAIRTRDEFAKGRRKASGAPRGGDPQLGQQGEPAKSGDSRKFEIYVPLNGNERTKAGEAGKGTNIQKKG